MPLSLSPRTILSCAAAPRTFLFGSDGRDPGSGYMARINWTAVGATIVLEAAFLAALIFSGVVPVGPRKQAPTVVQLVPLTKPATAVPPPAPTDVPDPRPEIRPEIVAPRPEVATPASPTPIAVSPQLADPVAVPTETHAAGPAQAAPAPGPVNVANLGTSQISGAPPRYPMEGRRKREEGMVVLRLVISEEGRITEITIHRSSGFASLDQAAIEAVRQWRWSPTIREGKPVPVTGLVEIPFRLKER